MSEKGQCVVSGSLYTINLSSVVVPFFRNVQRFTAMICLSWNISSQHNCWKYNYSILFYVYTVCDGLL